MRKAILLLLISSAPLFAQEATYHVTRIYVPPIDGVGMIDDMAYFYKQITGEIVRQYRTLGNSRRTSDYVITGKIMPLAGEGIDISQLPPGSENDENVLYVELYDNAIGEVIGSQFLTYNIPDQTTDETLSITIYYMLSGIPDLIEGVASYETWRNKWLYVNLNFLWTPRVYSSRFQSINIASVGAEAMVDFHFLNFMSLKLGAEIIQDWVVTYSSTGEYFADMVMDIPLALAFVFRPGDNFMLEPYVGINYNLSLTKVTTPYPLSWMAGAELGVRLGPGILTLDPRFAMDFNRSWITARPSVNYWRYTIHLGIGYKIGFFNRK